MDIYMKILLAITISLFLIFIIPYFTMILGFYRLKKDLKTLFERELDEALERMKNRNTECDTGYTIEQLTSYDPLDFGDSDEEEHHAHDVGIYRICSEALKTLNNEKY